MKSPDWRGPTSPHRALAAHLAPPTMRKSNASTRIDARAGDVSEGRHISGSNQLETDQGVGLTVNDERLYKREKLPHVAMATYR